MNIPSHVNTRRPRRVAARALLAVLAVAATACGSSSGSDTNDSPGTLPPAESVSTPTTVAATEPQAGGAGF